MALESDLRRVGVVGTGVIGSARLAVWQRLGVPIAGLYAHHRERGEALATAYGCPVFDDVEALLATSELADICLPTFLHRQAVEQAVRAGCRGIVCEKPLALEPHDVRAMFDLCERAQARLFVAMVVRFFPAYREVWDAVQTQAFGSVRNIALKRVGSPPPPLGSWFLDDGLSGGMLTDLLIHDVDYATWLAGDVATVEAVVEGSGQLQYAHLTLQHTSGAVSHIEGGWVADGPPLEISGSVVCAQGTLRIATERPCPPEQDPYVAQLRHFLDAIASGTPFLVTRREAERVAIIMAVARESTHRRCAMPVAPVGVDV